MGKAVGADLDAAGADVLGEDDVFLGGLDVFLELGLVGGVVIKDAAEAHQLDAGVLKFFLNGVALGFAEVDLDLVRVGGAEFDSLKLGLLAVLDDRVDVPIRGELVGDEPEFHRRVFGHKSGGPLLGSGPAGGLGKG